MQIAVLPDKDNVQYSDKDNIETVRAAYDALSDAQKAMISGDTYKKLTDAEAAVADQKAEVEDVEDLINALPATNEITYDDKDDVDAARAAYEALNDSQKALVDADTLQKLADAEDRIDSMILLGDADGDGKVTILDATVIQRRLAGLPVESFNEKAADVDGDGLTILDATAIQRYLAGMPVEFPIDQYV